MPIYALLFLHSTTFWKFALFVILFLLLEKLIQNRRLKRTVEIIGANMVGNDVLCLKMKLSSTNKKFHYKAGQYLMLCCPYISENEYHPFTITSAPQENYFSCHIRCRQDMDWTYELRKKLGFADTTQGNGSKKNLVAARMTEITESNRADLGVPNLKVDGPYGSASEEVFDYQTVLLVGAGIGVTPFVSVLKSMSLQSTSTKNSKFKVHFYWICRDQQEFDSFKSVLDTAISGFGDSLSLNLYVTGELDLKKVRTGEFSSCY
jgi:predicted ferric reductase